MEEGKERREEVGDDGGSAMTAGARSAAGRWPSLDFTRFYWTGSAWINVQNRFATVEEAQVGIPSFIYALIPLSVHVSLRPFPHSAAE